jgi:hypothetical protein
MHVPKLLRNYNPKNSKNERSNWNIWELIRINKNTSKFQKTLLVQIWKSEKIEQHVIKFEKIKV